MHDEIIAKTLLHNKFDLPSSKSKISSAIKLIVSSERFSNSLIWTVVFKQPFSSQFFKITLYSIDFRIFRTFNTAT